MTTVRELMPGDRINMNGIEGVFITADNHPRYTGLALVVWVFPNGHPLGISNSFDALSLDQYIGEALPQTPTQRMESLQEALNADQS